jgi:phenylacetate-CoA ligase
MAGVVSRLQRAILLRMLARQTPDKLLALSRKRLERVFACAASRSPAYRSLLQEAGVAATAGLSAAEILQRAPVLEKAHLFERFGVDELLVQGLEPASLAGILTSSGYGGGRFAFAVSTRRQQRSTPQDIDLGLQLAFGIDSRSTLLVNCLPMGVVFNSNAVCVANVSVREDMALAILAQAGPLFDQVILCTDPLFCKRLLDHAAAQGFDWGRRRTNVILGEEMFAEDFRSYLAGRLGVEPGAPDGPMLGSSMGVGELGLNLFFETRQTIALRRALHRQDPDRLLPAFFCFNPLRTFVEVLAPDAHGVGDLVISMLDERAPLPMIRYRTGDRARWLIAADTAHLDAATRAALDRQPFPVIAILGRDRDRIDEHWQVDHFKALLYRQPALAEPLSGAFALHGQPAGLQWDVQLARGRDAELTRVQGELAALLADSAAKRAAPLPQLRCYPYAAFPHGMGLDYERKFRYYQAP